MENQLNGTKCRDNYLKINVERHRRREAVIKAAPEKNPPLENLKVPSTVSNANRGGFRDGRSFAKWLASKLLYGEAKSVHHLGHMKEIISIHYDEWIDVKYTGGLRVLLRFAHTESAQNFLLEEENWKEWFNCLTRDESHIVGFKRMAWIKVVGLPIKHWCEANFRIIIARYGQIMIPFDDYMHRDDISCIRGLVSSGVKKNINDEVTVQTRGELLTIGIVEFEKTFSFDEEEQTFVSNSGLRHDKRNGVEEEVGEKDKDTLASNTNEMEEGETTSRYWECHC
ncbi:unnamed protein product [Lactuca saligna]|uniref:DUF4283 domain-containing protein n=1 Tax=Lactuca saligna TaxID=75948 RepID=A0AA35Y0C6_LACSI|nr:unnamed protein product [Lactuca saligna]